MLLEVPIGTRIPLRLTERAAVIQEDIKASGREVFGYRDAGGSIVGGPVEVDHGPAARTHAVEKPALQLYAFTIYFHLFGLRWAWDR